MIEVSVIEDKKEIREGLAVLINGTQGFACVSTYADCESALKNIENDQPDVILLDIEFDKKMSGIHAIEKLKRILPDVEIIMLTIHEENEAVFESLRQGASGYLVKHPEPADLLRAIKEVHENGSPMSMSIARMVAESFRKQPPTEPLSRREEEVLRKLCEGKSYQAIANELYIAKTTVKFHIRNIYQKLQVMNKAEAVRVATKDKLY